MGQPPYETFTIRSLKSGCTGAVKTWPVAPVLLDYLVMRNGLHPDNINADDAPLEPLDMISESATDQEEAHHTAASRSKQNYNIVELGAGTGYLGIGLALALNNDGESSMTCADENGASVPKVRIMCTDSDKQTIKNMRYNVHEQPKEMLISKAVRVQNLAWGDDIGGVEFTNAVDSQFGSKAKEEEDPLRLVTHVIGSDLHFGAHTLEPLSSVIAAFKLRVPDVIVVVLIKERSPGVYAGVYALKSKIEDKVESGLDDCSRDDQQVLKDFSVSVRDVLHEDVENMKMIEC